LALDGGGDCLRDRVDAADRADAECDAGYEDQETRQAAAHLAQREAQGEGEGPGGRQAIAFPASSGSASIRPERIETWRLHRAATTRSCVTSTSVMPRSAALAKSRSAICRPVAWSMFPVGSSAMSILGSGASA